MKILNSGWFGVFILGSLLSVVQSHAQPPAGTQTNTVRVALMNIVCDDNSYRSMQSAANFTAALQVKLEGDAKHQWVERTELNRAERELKLDKFEHKSGVDALRSGRWVKADWALFGRISTNSAGNRTMFLEVVDLQHAGNLAETNFPLASPAGDVFRVAAEDVSLTASATGALLNQADDIAKKSQGKNVVALFFLSPTTPNQRFSLKTDDLQRALEADETNQAPYFIHFPRADQAMDEADLMLSGLAENDPGVWERVANQYVWGTYATTDGMQFDRQTRKFVDQSLLKVSLNIWNGKGEPQAVTLTITNDLNPESVAKKLA